MSSSNERVDEFLVGVAVVVVPDGVTSGSENACRLSLSLSPTVSTAPESVGTVDIRTWPEQISRLIGSIVVHVNRPDQKAPAKGPDIDLSSFCRQSTRLWQRIFTDGATSMTSGFQALIRTLNDRALTTFDKAPAITSPTAELARAIDDLSGAAIATTLIQRVAARVFVDRNMCSPPLEEACFPGLLLGDRLPTSSVNTAVGNQSNQSGLSEVRGEAGAHLTALQAGSRDIEYDDEDATSYFVRQIGKPQFWRVNHEPQLRLDNNRAALRFRYIHSHHLASARHSPSVRRVADSSESDPAAEIARRKYAGIMCLHTLAKYLGLIIDVEVEAEILANVPSPSRSYGLIAASVGSVNTLDAAATQRRSKHQTEFDSPAPVISNPKEFVWTRYVLRPAASMSGTRGGGGLVAKSEYDYFGPSDKDETDSTPGSEGLLRLGQKSGSKMRFELSSLDVTNAAEKIMALAGDSDSKAVLESTRTIPDLVTRGIVLLDTGAEAEENARTDRRMEKATLSSPKILYAKDLVTGYQIDVALASRSDQHGESCRDIKRWRTLMGRSISYGRDVDPAFYRLHALQRQRVRDDGHVKIMARRDDTDEGTHRRIHQEIFTWTGESLAIPHVSEDDPGSQQDREECIDKKRAVLGLGICPESLTVDMVYDLPSERDDVYRRPSPLRDGSAYMFGARLQFLNGCSLDFGAAVKRYTSGKEQDLILGKNAQEPFIYQRRNVIHAPDVLLSWDDRLVRPKDEAALAAMAPGETIFELVVRSGAFESKSACRILVPPRVTFDLAEQGRLFDHTYRPMGAFAGKIRAQMDSRLGVFPVAQGGAWKFPVGTANAKPHHKEGSVKDSFQGESRGSVFVLDNRAKRSKIDFHADPIAQNVGFCFSSKGVPANTFEPTPHRIQFWSDGSNSVMAEPVILEVNKARIGSQSYLAAFNREDNSGQIADVSGSMTKLKKLSVTLVPGAIVDLEIFSVPPCSESSKHHAVARGLALLRKYHSGHNQIDAKEFGISWSDGASRFDGDLRRLVHGTAEHQNALCQELLTQQSLAQVTTKRVVKLVHAVDRPRQPRFLTSEGTQTDGKYAYDSAGRKSKMQSQELRIYPVTVAKNSGSQSDRSKSATAPIADKAKTPDGAAVTAPEEIRNSMEEAWKSYVDSYETWQGYVSDDGMLTRDTIDSRCLPRKKGDFISPEMQKHPRIDRRCWQSEEGGVTTFFAGEILIDRMTTSRVRCEAKWREFSPSMIRREGGKGKWVAKPPDRYARLFEINEIEQYGPADEPTLFGLNKVDVLRKDSLNLRNLAFPFIDGRARHLQLQLLATSRFTNYFPRGKSRDACTGALKTTRAKAWVTSTFRPAPPDVDRILPVFHWTTESHDDGREIVWKRESSLRIFMGRDWFSSGEGEKLALACWPKNLFGSNALEEAEAAPEIARNGLTELDPPLTLSNMPIKEQAEERLKHPYRRYGQFITRWGADPIRLSGQLDEAISADRFEPPLGEKVTKTIYNEDLLLSLPGPQVATSSAELSEDTNQDHTPPLPVSIVAYDVAFDSSQGTWFSDITVDHGAAYFPFVQLGLVRYQAHAGKGLELSYPVPTFAQLPPRRQGKVTFVDDRTINFELSGVGYHRAETGLTVDRYKSDFPLLDIKLMQAAQSGSIPGRRGHINWHPVSSHLQECEWLDQIPVQRGAEVVWQKTITLPRSRQAVSYALLVEEFEHMAGDKLATSEAKSFEELRFDTELMKRGPLFSHIIDLRPCSDQ